MRHHEETLSTVEPILSTSPQLTNCWTQTNTGFIWKAQNSRTGMASPRSGHQSVTFMKVADRRQRSVALASLPEGR